MWAEPQNALHTLQDFFFHAPLPTRANVPQAGQWYVARSKRRGIDYQTDIHDNVARRAIVHVPRCRRDQTGS